MTTGPEGQFFFSARDAALKGPLFHGIIGGMARGECIAGIDWWKSGALSACIDVEERRFSAAFSVVMRNGL